MGCDEGAFEEWKVECDDDTLPFVVIPFFEVELRPLDDVLPDAADLLEPLVALWPAIGFSKKPFTAASLVAKGFSREIAAVLPFVAEIELPATGIEAW